MTRPRSGHAAGPVAALVALTLAGGVSAGATPAAAAVSGHTVSAAAADIRAGLTADAATTAFQDRLDSALQRMLDTVLGPGRSTVATNVELDLDQVTTSSTTYTRDASAGALSERVSERSYTGDSGAARYRSSSASRVNALDELHETRREAPGDIVRLSVAVLIDDAAAANVDLAQVRELIGVAAGIDVSRGDQLTVTAMPLRSGTATPADSAVAQSGAASHAGPRTALVVAALILLIGGMLVAVRRRRARAAAASAAADRHGLLRAELYHHRPPVPAATVPIAAAPDRGREQQRAIMPVDPARAAQHLRGWIGPAS
ncbi:flagellar M-ring protein FliF C-terminal domain-containing protein [Actinoplanes sp. CA-252034]|uniref:flagellar M-ring protein FliF C-terminal domain-containing protein n=1 Tax=Actinoplanes sp. CA-252034 TaxID=3239906 RepID=UPI003D98174D